MAVAKVFKSGNSQAVRLPKAFRLKGPEVEIERRGDEIVLREMRKTRVGLAEAFDALVSMPMDAFENIKEIVDRPDGSASSFRSGQTERVGARSNARARR